MPTEADRRREDPVPPPGRAPSPLRRFQGTPFDALLLCLAAAASSSDPQAVVVDVPRRSPGPPA